MHTINLFGVSEDHFFMPKTLKSLSFLIFFLLSTFSITEALADIIYLKNGGKLEGKILKKTSKNLTLETGVGLTLNINNRDIARIEQTGISLITGNARVLQSYQNLQDAFKELKIARKKALRKIRNIELHQKKMENIKKSISKKEVDFEIAGKKLQQANPNSVGSNQYNMLISSVNNIRSEIEILRLKSSRMERKTSDNPADSDYFQKLNELENEIQEKLQSPELNKDGKVYLEKLQAQIKEFQNDFLYVKIHATGVKGQSAILQVTVNDRVKGRFLLDTGASHMVFSQAFASRLGLNLAGVKSIKSTLADGKTVDAKPVILRKVKVGNAVEENVEAVVLPAPPAQGIDGLLGMSFLKNYMIQLDPKNNKLTLSKFKQ